MKDECSRCRFYAKTFPGEVEAGDCRRRAPASGWPPVCGWDWCGEFELRPGLPHPVPDISGAPKDWDVSRRGARPPRDEGIGPPRLFPDWVYTPRFGSAVSLALLLFGMIYYILRH